MRCRKSRFHGMKRTNLKVGNRRRVTKGANPSVASKYSTEFKRLDQCRASEEARTGYSTA